jgi:hypothetical protein
MKGSPKSRLYVDAYSENLQSPSEFCLAAEIYQFSGEHLLQLK